MVYKFERVNKYLVLKLDDCHSFLTEAQKLHLDDICDTIGYQRKQLHKEENRYVVVNEDESYAEEVWALIREEEERKHGLV
jgi:hypothetical protein